MLFRVLGPLEIEAGGRPVTLRGVLQRATLGALLLNANKVVSTNQLIKTLWPGEPPATARKMLQNAIAGVRAALRASPGGQEVAVVTHAPGYLLRTDPDRVDLCRFHVLAAEGRDHLVRGDFERAAQIFEEALALRRGRVLADLMETGILWPEAAALDNSILSVVEDYADAQLTLNRYHEVIERLEAVLAEGEFACRERMLAQLMLALYRAGRQADALSLYRRTRNALVEGLGLDPSRELQDLERAILAHDPVLDASAEPVRPEPARPVPVEVRPETAVVERKPVTVMMVRVGGAEAERDPEDLRDIWLRLTGAIGAVAGNLGGDLRPHDVGPVWTVHFGVPRTREDDAERAVRAAVQIRDRIRASVDESVPVHIALTTGEALVAAFPEEARTEVTGGLIDQCLAQVAAAPLDTVVVCDTTRVLTAGLYGYERLATAAGVWQLRGPAPRTRPTAIPFVGRRRELHQLTSMLLDVVRDRRPRLATVVGEPGIGKSRLISEYAAAPAVSANAATCVVVRTPSFGREPVRTVAANLVCGLAKDPKARPAPTGRLDLRQVCAGAREAVFRAADRGPLVIVLEDLHWADDPLLDFAEDLVSPDLSLPLLMVATARSELLDRRPHWASLRGNATAIILEPLPDEAIEVLLRSLSPDGGLDRTSAYWADLIRRAGGNPYFARECVGELNRDREVSLPRTVQRVIAARIDTLRAQEKDVLRAAAALGDEVYESDVAAVAGRDRQEVATLLRILERRGMLVRVPLHATDGRGISYRFRHAWFREVAYAQLPRRERAERRRRAAVWLRRPETEGAGLWPFAAAVTA